MCIMGKAKDIKKEVESKLPDKVVTEKVGPVDVGVGINPSNKDPYLFVGGRNEEDSNYIYARAGSKGDKQVGFGKTDERGSIGVDIGKNFIGIGGQYKFKKGGSVRTEIAKGCGKVLEDRRKVTKYY